MATAEDLHVATEELSSKLAAWTPTFFGEVPYQLGYAAETIQFFAWMCDWEGREFHWVMHSQSQRQNRVVNACEWL